jgi:hypothetical protein
MADTMTDKRRATLFVIKNMRTFRSTRSISLYLSVVITACLFISWGTLGHERINRLAVLQLPEEPGLFFYNHLDFITQEATVPDLRKYTLADKTEYPRHYADLENYGSRDTLPLNMEALTKKHSPEFLSKNGTLPWYLEEMMQKLTKAFKEKRKTEILFLAADIGHYIADAHMPLHTSVNHDGQFTGQKGIHAFWEAHLPELYADGYTYKYRPAKYIDTVRTAILDMIYQSHSLVPVLLDADKKLRTQSSTEQIYELDAEGKIKQNKFKQPIHNKQYADLYHTALNGMVESQLNKAIQTTADFWYTAWVNAGSPNLKDLDRASLNQESIPRRKKEIENFKKNKIEFPVSEKEF